MTTGKTIALTIWTFVGKVMSLLFNMLSRLVIAFLQRSKRLLISWLQSLSTVILEPKKIKSVTVSILSPSICPWSVGTGWIILVFWMLSFKPAFSLSYFTFIKRLFSSSLLSAIRVVSSAEYIMRNAGLEETQAGIKIVGRNINITSDIQRIPPSCQKVKSLLMKVKEESENSGLKLNI